MTCYVLRLVQPFEANANGIISRRDVLNKDLEVLALRPMIGKTVCVFFETNIYVLIFIFHQNPSLRAWIMWKSDPVQWSWSSWITSSNQLSTVITLESNSYFFFFFARMCWKRKSGKTKISDIFGTKKAGILLFWSFQLTERFYQNGAPVQVDLKKTGLDF